MICPICHDILFLSRKSSAAGPDDVYLARDLTDTLHAHREGCVGMAANMIGKAKKVIVFDDGGVPTVVFNPEIVKCAGPYEAEEGCLSLEGTRKTIRYETIKLRYQNDRFQTRLKTYTGWTAQIIQHEIDHCNGIII